MDVEQFIDFGLIETNNDIFADLDDGHAHLAAHFLHIAGGNRVFRNVDLLELDIVRSEIFHRPLAPAASRGGENKNFGLFSFLFAGLSGFNVNGHGAVTFVYALE